LPQLDSEANSLKCIIEQLVQVIAHANADHLRVNALASLTSLIQCKGEHALLCAGNSPQLCAALKSTLLSSNTAVQLAALHILYRLALGSQVFIELFVAHDIVGRYSSVSCALGELS